jgi:nucleoside phosphorylase
VNLILLVTATQLEAKPLLTRFNGTLLPVKNDLYLGQINDTQVAVLISGIGKVNTSASIVQTLVQNQNPVISLIWFGLSGAPPAMAQIGDVCIANSTIDLDLGYCLAKNLRQPFSFVTGSERAFVDGELKNSFLKRANDVLWKGLPDGLKEYLKQNKVELKNTQAHQGTVACGDIFWYNLQASQYAQMRCQELTGQNYLACSMEANTAGLIANRYKIPFAAVLGVSNYDQPLNANDNFKKAFASRSLACAADNLAFLISGWLLQK